MGRNGKRPYRKLDPIDRVFSKYIRAKAGWRCEWWDEHGNKCTNVFTPEYAKGLHCSHFYGRRNMSTRFCPTNVDSLCFKHHRWVEENPAEYWRYKIEKIGVDKMNELRKQFLKTVPATSTFKEEQLVLWKSKLEEIMR